MRKQLDATGTEYTTTITEHESGSFWFQNHKKDDNHLGPTIVYQPAKYRSWILGMLSDFAFTFDDSPYSTNRRKWLLDRIGFRDKVELLKSRYWDAQTLSTKKHYGFRIGKKSFWLSKRAK